MNYFSDVHPIATVVCAHLILLGLLAYAAVSVRPGPNGEGTFEKALLWVSKTFGTPARDIQKFKNGVNDLYLRRFYVTPRWLARFLERRKWWKLPTKIFLHHILRSDDDREKHSHPWPFTSLIVLGSYKEEILKGWSRITESGVPGPWKPVCKERIATPGTILRNTAQHTHRVEIIKPVWSLVFVWPAEQVWGFWCQADDESQTPYFVPWRKYLGIPEERDAEEDVIRNGSEEPPAPLPTHVSLVLADKPVATLGSEEATPVVAHQSVAELLASTRERLSVHETARRIAMAAERKGE